jgi:hypothetical protein
MQNVLAFCCPIPRRTTAAGAAASGCFAHKGRGNRFPHHQQHFAVEAIGLCHKLFHIVVFNDVAVFDDAHPLFFNLHPLAQQSVPEINLARYNASLDFSA